MHRLPFSSNTPALGLAPPNEVPGWMSCAIHFFQANIIPFRSFYFLTGMPPYQLRFAEPVKICENKQSFHFYPFLDAR